MRQIDLMIKAMRSEENLLTNQQLLDIIEFLPDATFVIDQEKKVIAWNRAMEELTGVPKEDITGQGDYAYAVPFYGKPRPILIDLVDLPDRQIEQYKYVKRKGNKLYGEIFIPSAFKGKETILWGVASPLFDSNGHLVGAIETIRDITERKRLEDELRKHREHFETLVEERTVAITRANEQLQREITERRRAEEALRESENKFRSLYEQANDAIFLLREDTIVDCNSKTLTMFGCQRKGIIGATLYRYSPAVQPGGFESKKKALEKIKAVLNGEPQFFEWQHMRVDGTCFIAEVSLNLIKVQNQVNIQAIIRDITKRRHAEEELWERKKSLKKQVNYLNTLIENMNELFYTYDPNANITFVNKHSWDVLGYRQEEMVGKNILELVPGDYKDKAQKELQNRLYQRKEGSFEAPILHKNGKQRFFKFSASPIIEDGEITGGMVLAEDITERKRATEALYQEKEQLAVTLSSIGDAVIVVDTAETITLINPVAESLTGWSKSEAIGRPLGEVFRIVNEYSRQPAENPVRKVFAGKKVVGLANHTALIARDGTEWSIADSAAAIQDAAGNTLGVILVFRDVTEDRQWEKTLKTNERGALPPPG